MRVPTILAVFAAAVLTTWAALAADPAIPTSTIMIFENLAAADAPSVLSFSDRLVWDRLTGRAVAQASASATPRLERIPHSLLRGRTGEDFVAVLREELPDYVAGARGESRYAIKEPAVLVKPHGAPSQRPEAGEQLAGSPCIGEGFEVAPIWSEDGGPWWHYQGGQPENSGNHFWLDDNCDSFSGSWEAHAGVRGGTGHYLPCGAVYGFHSDSWLEYAPWITCVSGAPDAALSFFARLQTEGGHDRFYYVATVDGTNYSGYSLSGNYADTWYAVTEDMRSWHGLGDLTSYPRFALAFVFQSDGQINQGFGVRVDDIALDVATCPAIDLSPASLPGGKVGTGYYLAISATGGTAPYIYAKTSGTRPTGLSLSPEGVLSGVPTEAGTFNFTVTATDALGCTGSRDYTMTIAGIPPPVVFSMTKMADPFRIVVNGSNLQGNIKVYINANRWTKVARKSATKVTIKGGASLKAAVPQGTPTDFTFVNPDGGAVMVTGWSW